MATTLGNVTVTSSQTVNANATRASRFTATENFTANSVWIYWHTTVAGAKVAPGIYGENLSNSAVPGDLLAQGYELTGTTAGAWKGYALDTPVTIVAGAYYWVSIFTDTGVIVKTQSAGTNRTGSDTYADGINDPWDVSSSGSSSTAQMGAYLSSEVLAGVGESVGETTDDVEGQALGLEGAAEAAGTSTANGYWYAITAGYSYGTSEALGQPPLDWVVAIAAGTSLALADANFTASYGFIDQQAAVNGVVESYGHLSQDYTFGGTTALYSFVDAKYAFKGVAESFGHLDEQAQLHGAVLSYGHLDDQHALKTYQAIYGHLSQLWALKTPQVVHGAVDQKHAYNGVTGLLGAIEQTFSVFVGDTLVRSHLTQQYALRTQRAEYGFFDQTHAVETYLTSYGYVDHSSVLDAHGEFVGYLDQDYRLNSLAAAMGYLDQSYQLLVDLLVQTAGMTVMDMNLASYATSYFAQFPMLEYAVNEDDVLLGINEDGVWRLDADDDNGERIQASLLTAIVDFGSDAMKRVDAVYLGGEIGAAEVVSHYGNREAVSMFSTTDGLMNARAKVGKDAKSRYWQFEIRNRLGDDLEVDQVAITPLEMTRRVG